MTLYQVVVLKTDEKYRTVPMVWELLKMINLKWES